LPAYPHAFCANALLHEYLEGCSQLPCGLECPFGDDTSSTRIKTILHHRAQLAVHDRIFQSTLQRVPYYYPEYGVQIEGQSIFGMEACFSCKSCDAFENQAQRREVCKKLMGRHTYSVDSLDQGDFG